MSATQCVVVLGMHRSGTSALAGMVGLLGAEVGSDLMSPSPEWNPRGYWEHAEIVRLHDELLEALGSSWRDVRSLPEKWWLGDAAQQCRQQIVAVLRTDFADSALWLVKDPRMCRLVPMWKDILANIGSHPHFIVSLRDPAHVAHSLLKRDRLPVAIGNLLWLTHYLEAERQTRDASRVFVPYESLVLDWRSVQREISAALGLKWPTTSAAAAASVDAFIDSELRHNRDAGARPDHPSCKLAREAFELLKADSQSAEGLDHLRKEVESLVALVAPWAEALVRVSRVADSVTGLERAIAELRTELDQVKASRSWRMTEPLRIAKRLVRKRRPSP